MPKTVRIYIEPETWQFLNSEKKPGDNFDKVILQLKEDAEKWRQQNKN